jgi:hypothetical protein
VVSAPVPPRGRLGDTGHTGRVLLQGIRDVGDEPVVLSPADPEAESVNTYWLGASPHERLGVSVEEVVIAFEEAADRIRSRVREAGHRGRATFYVWHDREAGQLRCSTGTRPPFGRGYAPIVELGPIVADFLGDGEPGFVRPLSLTPFASDAGWPDFGRTDDPERVFGSGERDEFAQPEGGSDGHAFAGLGGLRSLATGDSGTAVPLVVWTADVTAEADHVAG